MYATIFQTAASAADAVAKLEAAEDGKLLAGGQTLIPAMKARLAAPTELVSLAKAGLAGIALSGDTITIGALRKFLS